MIGAALPVDPPSTTFGRESRTFLRFASEHPAIYRLMFGSHLDKDVRATLGQASDRLFAYRGQRLAHQPPNVRAAKALGCWALLHGIETLASDGRLERHGQEKANFSATLAPFMTFVFAQK